MMKTALDPASLNDGYCHSRGGVLSHATRCSHHPAPPPCLCVQPLAALKSPLVLDDLSGWVTPQVDTTGDQPTVFDAGVLLSSTPSARHLKVKARRSSNFSIPGSPSSMASTPTAASPSRDGRNETRGQTSTSRGASDGQTRRRQSDGSAGADDDDNDDSDSHSDGSAASQQSRDSPT